MRTIFLLLAVLASLVSLAQDNNPFDAEALQYLSPKRLIKEDLKAGSVKDLTEEYLQYYSNLVPLKKEGDLDAAPRVMQALKNKDLDLHTIVDESHLTGNSKHVYRELCEQSVRLGASGFRNYLRNKVEDIKKTRMGEREKEFLLSLASILYHGVEAGQGCVTTIATPEGEMVDDSGTGCIVIGMAVGHLVRNIICGTLCGIGGVIVGGIIGALT